MTQDDNKQDKSITQVGSALHQMREIYSRMRFLEENPGLLRQRPDVYIGLGNELMALFTEGCDRDSWFWYAKNSGRLDQE